MTRYSAIAAYLKMKTLIDNGWEIHISGVGLGDGIGHEVCIIDRSVYPAWVYEARAVDWEEALSIVGEMRFEGAGR